MECPRMTMPGVSHSRPGLESAAASFEHGRTSAQDLAVKPIWEIPSLEPTLRIDSGCHRPRRDPRSDPQRIVGAPFPDGVPIGLCSQCRPRALSSPMCSDETPVSRNSGRPWTNIAILHTTPTSNAGDGERDPRTAARASGAARRGQRALRGPHRVCRRGVLKMF